MTKKADHKNGASVPRYQLIARQIKSAIERGELTPGHRLPASRIYAQELGISRATVENAYGELVAQGWLERHGQSGTFVSNSLAMRQPAPAPAVFGGEDNATRPFQLGLPALDLFPRGLWARVMGRRLRTQSRGELATGDLQGEYALREAIAAYLRLSRSIECLPQQIFLTSGYGASMDMVLGALGQAGDQMWVEDPGYPLIRPVIARHRIGLAPVPVDDQGMDIDLACSRFPNARFALLTPAHQSPLGVALSLPRRRQLLDWASRQQRWVIEDDYDSEFRYQGKPLPPLKSLDAPQRVIYAGTFSKSLFPALRIAWLVVPLPLVAIFHGQASLSPCTVPRLWQLTLADFIREGHFWRHLKKMRHHYAQRRQWLEQALMGEGFQVMPQLGGIQLVVSVEGDDRLLAGKANDAGLAVQALSRWRIVTPGAGGLVMSFTNLGSAEMASERARQLRRAIS